MKMAKASEDDLTMAMELANYLDAIERGYMPDVLAENDEQVECIDPDAACIEHHPKRQQMEDALLCTLYHHQGGSSPVGQPIRKLLGIGQHDRMTDEQIAQAKKFGGAA